MTETSFGCGLFDGCFSRLQDLPAEQLRPPPAGELLYGPPHFWTTFHDMLVDVYTVSVGPEKRAFQMALWLAVFNQARVLRKFSKDFGGHIIASCTCRHRCRSTRLRRLASIRLGCGLASLLRRIEWDSWMSAYSVLPILHFDAARQASA